MSNITFSTKFLPHLSNKNNSVISPYGIAAVLSMAAEGANKNSLDEILSCLGFNSFDELRSSVLDVSTDSCDAFKSGNSIMFVQGNENITLIEQFKETMRNIYSATVDEKTRDCESYLRLQNISTFEAEWLFKMKRETESHTRFQNANGKYCHPVFLSCNEQLRCYRDDSIFSSVKAVAVPYKFNGNEVPFELILIDSEKTLTKDLLESIIASMKFRKCEVEFPEFSITNEFDLVPIMNKLGLSFIFEKDHTVFDSIATKPLYVKQFMQKAEIKVDEHGTVAKAFTFMDKCLGGSFSDSSDSFIFNRPFNYFLRNTDTGDVLFIGKVNNLS